MRIFRLPSVCAQPCVSAAITLQAKLPRRSRAGEPLMSLVIAWLRAFSPSQPFPDRAAPCAEWPPKSCPASAAPISLRPGAVWKARWRMACFVERAPCFPARIFFDLLADKFTGLRGGGLPFALIAARTFDGLFLRQRANAQLTAL